MMVVILNARAGSVHSSGKAEYFSNRDCGLGPDLDMVRVGRRMTVYFSAS